MQFETAHVFETVREMLAAELETGGVLREISDGEATNGEATEQN